MKLTEKQKAFCDYYIETLNATESYKRAYKSKNDNTAAKEGHKLLKNPKITQEIEKRLAEKESERIASQDEVLEYLTRVLRGEEKETYVKLDGEGKEITIESPPSVRERTKAAELLGKRYSTFTEKIEHTGETTVNNKMNFSNMSYEELERRKQQLLRELKDNE